MTLIDDLFYRALFAGLGVSLAAAPLGCFIVWRRMAYFSDATAHVAILGVAIALLLEISIFAGVLAVAILMGLAVWGSASRGHTSDTSLGVISHSALAVSLVALSQVSGIRVDVSAYLFGDILAVARTDLLVIWVGGLAVSGVILWRWSALLMATLNPELARASGVSARREELIMTLTLAVTVAVAIKVVGALLIGALMIIPAAAARPLTKTPEQMAVLALVFAYLSTFGGLQSAFLFDTPAGPSIVCAAATIFAVTNAFAWLRRS